MESTREERLQMRQRGAGTRQIKAVDFGFSFGAPAPGPSGSAPISLFPEPEKSQTQPAPAPAPRAATPQSLKVSSQPGSQTIIQSQRTPGSARNNLPRRPSTYDIPSDERPEVPRSNKRRRLSAWLNPELMISYADYIGDSSEPRDTPSKQSAPEPVADTSEPIQNGGSVVTEAQAQAQAQASHEADISMSDVQDAQIDAPDSPTLPEEPLNTEAEVDGSAGTINADSTAQPEQTPSTIQTPKLDNTTEITKKTLPQKFRSPKDALQEAQPIVDPTLVDSTDPSSQKQRKSRSPPQADKAPEESEEEQMIEKANPSTSSQGPRNQKTRIPRAKSTTTDAFDANQPEEAAVIQPDRSHQPNTLDVTDVATEDTPVAQKPFETIKKTQGRKGRAENGGRAPAQAVEEKAPPEAGAESRPEVTQSNALSKDKRPRGRPSLSGKKNDGEAQKDQGLKRPPEAGKDIESGPSKPRRGRPSLSGKKADGKAQIRPETEPDAEPGPSKSRRGRPAKNKLATEPEPTAPKNQLNPETEHRPEPGQENAPEPSKSHRGRAGKKITPTSEPDSTISEEYPSTESEPRPESAEQEEAPEPSKPRRGRPGKKSKSAAEPESIALEEQPNNESEPRPEPDQEDEPAPSKARRGKTKKSRAAEEPETTTREAEAETETAQERRKPREPRGETVPVTVHRLFNPSALGAMYTSAGSGEEDEESADELSTRQKTKLPNRGGVNPADVLSQICRETLEKTLTALNNGIANETNTQRRAEWTRKRRAVEAFGSELDGRLLDLSEMLDSNFVLGVQLRKTKREMMDLRSHLYKVRRERESIALQMDAVRDKHMEEENARNSRTTINNSLHSLELALDRSQHRPSLTTNPSPADLEFMLRTVAEDVSSRAPGAQGGLLNQVRAFNEQLETTARRLER
ncbi:hypothetical protein N7507_002171 [Penicillium longicatenatum]|nr:hypothetical protein N7507_002171 [Penicillium longicatenatum]